MNILVTGANGQLGSEIRKRENEYKSWNFVYVDLPELDITNLAKIKEVVQRKSITAIINCAAYTAVDKAETVAETAYNVNVTGAENLAKVAAEFKLKLIHISTDFVFDGHSYLPYIESDTPNPLSVYGKTKLEGEEKVMQVHPSSIILRTAWLYSTYGTNFVKTMRKLGNEREELKVIFDQVGTPTWAGDLTASILIILSSLEEGNEKRGMYHFSNEGVASWYDFAVEIMALSKIKCVVLPIETKEYPTSAPRPSYSVLNKKKIKTDFAIEIPHWKESLRKCILEIEQKEYLQHEK
ncbi:dTDP-4-dehydrorhamnose reductase [Lutibacter sp. B1]|uniref:dTDP-4-dehydrorhamnose reductase n=1 Tax=Lutibacter sp. B1 TaxID=2725996 RepID=UPI001457810C|nr:dTDP-4-dehydrorhamnose reductase [Lutibacter sp. B1]NLP58830.1 dTDP-4-dehydrorhamnose reductase [Lutibacter sp. B1]